MSSQSIPPQVLKSYYKHCYPAKLLWRWLNTPRLKKDALPLYPLALDHTKVEEQSNTNNKYREISFTTDQGVWIRNVSYDSYTEFRFNIIENPPLVIHLGALYTREPSQTITFQTLFDPETERMVTKEIKNEPLARELIFDLDITDYEVSAPRKDSTGVEIGSIRKGVCGCTSGVCKKCWIFMYAGMLVVDTELRQTFGLDKIYYFFSGSKGFHCWVLDHKVKWFTSAQRQDMLDWFYFAKFPLGYIHMTCVKTKVNRYLPEERITVQDTKVEYCVHPSLEQAYILLLPLFRYACKTYGLCQGPRGYQALVERFLEQKEDQEALRVDKNEPLPVHLHGDDKCLFIWLIHNVREYMRAYQGITHGPNRNKTLQFNSKGYLVNPVWKIANLLYRIVFFYMYPRFDSSVTVIMNHATKSPFSIHPTTHRIAIPLTLESAKDFDPNLVPTVFDIQHDLDQLPSSPEEGDDDHKLWRHTRFTPFMKQFVDTIRSTNI